MIEVENTDVNIVRNIIPMRNHMPASAYGLKAISDWLCFFFFSSKPPQTTSKVLTTSYTLKIQVMLSSGTEEIHFSLYHEEK